MYHFPHVRSARHLLHGFDMFTPSWASIRPAVHFTQRTNAIAPVETGDVGMFLFAGPCTGTMLHICTSLRTQRGRSEFQAYTSNEERVTSMREKSVLDQHKRHDTLTCTAHERCNHGWPTLKRLREVKLQPRCDQQRASNYKCGHFSPSQDLGQQLVLAARC